MAVNGLNCADVSLCGGIDYHSTSIRKLFDYLSLCVHSDRWPAGRSYADLFIYLGLNQGCTSEF